MIEVQRVFLAKFLPEDLKEKKSREIVELFPGGNMLVKNGAEHSIIKDGEHRHIGEAEFRAMTNVTQHKVHRIRYYYDDNIAFDIFKGAHQGLVLIHILFTSPFNKAKFSAPDYCLADVTDQGFAQAEHLAYHSYDDIALDLAKNKYAWLE